MREERKDRRHDHEADGDRTPHSLTVLVMTIGVREDDHTREDDDGKESGRSGPLRDRGASFDQHGARVARHARCPKAEGHLLVAARASPTTTRL